MYCTGSSIEGAPSMWETSLRTLSKSQLSTIRAYGTCGRVEYSGHMYQLGPKTEG